MTEEIEIKSYKVLKQLGWKGGIYKEGDTVEMEPRFAEFYLEAKVLEESKSTEPAPESIAPQALPQASANVADAEEAS